MITEIHLENYRCFNKHKVLLGPLSVIVGENNAGKTTLVEALRLIAAAGPANANRNARERIKTTKACSGLVNLASGKEILSELSGWSKSTFGVSFSPEAVATSMKPGDISDEMRAVIADIEHSRDFTE